MQKEDIDTVCLVASAGKLASRGRTPLFTAVNGEPAALIATADPVKPSAAAVIRTLHAQGLRTAMVTGDNRATAASIAAELGIDQVTAEVLPDGKLKALADPKQQGCCGLHRRRHQRCS